MAEHSPLPWGVVGGTSYIIGRRVDERRNEWLVETLPGNPRASADAAYIVLACNSYPAMREALQAINRRLSETRTLPADEVGREIEWCIDHARAALSPVGERVGT